MYNGIASLRFVSLSFQSGRNQKHLVARSSVPRRVKRTTLHVDNKWYVIINSTRLLLVAGRSLGRERPV
jgi:hypothetical protein